ncbi:MAG: sulfatase [Thermoanaerobaculia bacterium]|nr:sulfatase [Thermoanaerobaculia bacterium]
MSITRRTALRTLAAAAAVPNALFAQRPIPRNAPNILFIMTDDQRKDALGVYGNPILKTPNIDRIGNEGARVEQFFVTNSLCAPSRASFLTGLYAHAHGVMTNGSGEPHRNQGGLRATQRTFVHELRDAGYHTLLAGKWHLRSEPSGFDEWVILPGGGGPYVDPPMNANGARVRMRGYADDVVGDQALELLQHRPADRPFLLLMNFKSPHRDWIPAPRFANAFENDEIPLPRTFEDRLDGDALRRARMAIADMPDFAERGVPATLPRDERKRRNYEALVKNYYRTILSVDENTGRALEFLDRNNLATNTLVLFSSDNGFFLGEYGLYDKRLMYEPSIRVPMLVRWPARIKPMVERANMILNVDVAPSILDAAGVPQSTMHGRSFLPLLTGGEIAWRDAFYYEFHEYPDYDHCVRKHRGIRTTRWKLIEYWERPVEYELYDLERDPDETSNLAASQPRLVRELKQRMESLRRELAISDAAGPVPAVVPCVPGRPAS